MLDGFTLGNYLLLVEHTGRILRDGKVMITAEVSDILARLGSSVEAWHALMQRLRGGRMLGRFIVGSREVLQNTADRLGDRGSRISRRTKVVSVLGRLRFFDVFLCEKCLDELTLLVDGCCLRVPVCAAEILPLPLAHRCNVRSRVSYLHRRSIHWSQRGQPFLDH